MTDKPKINRDYELFKVQVYADRTHTILTIWASLAFVLFSLVSIFYGLFYEGVFGFNLSKALTGWGGIIIIVALVIVTIWIMARRFNENSARVSDMIEFVNEGNALPTLDKLHKWKRNTESETIVIEHEPLKLPTLKDNGIIKDASVLFLGSLVGAITGVLVQYAVLIDNSTGLFYFTLVTAGLMFVYSVIASFLIHYFFTKKKA